MGTEQVVQNRRERAWTAHPGPLFALPGPAPRRAGASLSSAGNTLLAPQLLVRVPGPFEVLSLLVPSRRHRKFAEGRAGLTCQVPSRAQCVIEGPRTAGGQ